MSNQKCNICKNNRWQTIYSKNILHPLWWTKKNNIESRLNYRICQSCGYITLYPKYSNKVYDNYYKLSPTPSRNCINNRKKIVARRRKFISDNINIKEIDNVIEVGPAYGDFLRSLKIKFKIGIEPSKHYCEYNESSKLPLRYYQCMLDEVKNSASELFNSSDLVIASHVLEHAFNPRNFIRHLKSLLKYESYLFIEVPSIEAMSEVEHSIYQTLHFGHISQFSATVLNQLVVSECLDPVKVEIFKEHNYPVIRAIYIKTNRSNHNISYFKKHSETINSQAKTAKKLLSKYLLSKKISNLLIWGCGQDMLDVVNVLNKKELSEFKAKVKLVDMNPKKQNKKIMGIKIDNPNKLSSKNVDLILIISRSNLVQSDITQKIKKIFPRQDQISLYN